MGLWTIVDCGEVGPAPQVRPRIDGRILALGGDLHQYVKTLVLEDIAAGDTIWVGTASHDENDELLGDPLEDTASAKDEAFHWWINASTGKRGRLRRTLRGPAPLSNH